MDGLSALNVLAQPHRFCVLHPASCAVRACRVKTEWNAGKAIPHYSADAPFENMKSISTKCSPFWAKVFPGDVFEMEDQRNWIDASFKPFCTAAAPAYP
jgi:hypothetical protein